MAKAKGARNIAKDHPPRTAIAIMAAGKGTRLKSKHPKVLHEVGGKPILAHVIAAAANVVAPGNIFTIIGHEAEAVRAGMFTMRDDGIRLSMAGLTTLDEVRRVAGDGHVH